MKSKYFLSTLAIVLAIGLSAFTLPKNKEQNQFFTSHLVWFQVNNSGQAIDPSDGREGTNPFGCPNSSTDLCARALTFDTNPSMSEVILNEDETTYSIKSGVDISSGDYYDDELYKATP